MIKRVKVEWEEKRKRKLMAKSAKLNVIHLKVKRDSFEREDVNANY